MFQHFHSLTKTIAALLACCLGTSALGHSVISSNCCTELRLPSGCGEMTQCCCCHSNRQAVCRCSDHDSDPEPLPADSGKSFRLLEWAAGMDQAPIAYLAGPNSSDCDLGWPSATEPTQFGLDVLARLCVWRL
jgi:hypothetical protein